MTHIGTIILSNTLTLKDVLYVPGFQFNLISIPKICSDLKCSATFTDNKCLLQSSSMKPQLLGRLNHGLYYVVDSVIKQGGTMQAGYQGSFDSISSVTALVNSSHKDSETVKKAKLWHLRLGHIPFSQLQYLESTIGIKSCSIDDFCQICPCARQARLSFSSSSTKSVTPFQLVHADIWGPYQIAAHNHCKFFLTLVDDYTRMTWVFFLKHKSDAPAVFKHFVAYIETQFQATVKTVRTDNAQELCAGDMKLFFLDKGIMHQRSCADTPQQNGIVERKHRHLLETARALFFQSKLPISFWSECVLCAVHLINRMPLSVLNHVSPYEKLFGKPPSLDYLKIFGCLAYVSTSKHHRLKFEPRAEKHVFIGYPPGQKGYKLLNLSTHKIIISRDVVFYEQHFPYHFSDTSTSPFSKFFLPTTTNTIPYVDDLPDIFSFPSDSVQPSSTSSLPLQSSPPTPSSISSHTSPDLRRSTRTKKLPSHLDSYVCNSVTSHTEHWCNLVAYSVFPHIKLLMLTLSL